MLGGFIFGYIIGQQCVKALEDGESDSLPSPQYCGKSKWGLFALSRTHLAVAIYATAASAALIYMGLGGPMEYSYDFKTGVRVTPEPWTWYLCGGLILSIIFVCLPLSFMCLSVEAPEETEPFPVRHPTGRTTTPPRHDLPE